MSSNSPSVTSDVHHHPPPTVREPLAEPISVIGPEYLAPYPVDLTITEKISGLSSRPRNYDVTDVNGHVVFKIKGKALSLSEKRLLVDSAGNPLLTLCEKGTVHDRWQAFRGKSTDSNDLLFSVKRSNIFQRRTALDVFFATNISEDVCDLKIKGSSFEGSCDIFNVKSDVVLAQMRRQCTKDDQNNAYEVAIYPNVDYAFIMGLIMILQEIKNYSLRHTVGNLGSIALQLLA
ncbi:hypothetical protein AAC387_Pa01g4057 [Persea americana]